MTPFSPRRAAQGVLEKWWLIVLLAVLGGLLGLLFHFQRQPLYQATVSFSADVDYSQTGPLPDRNLDQIMGAVSNLFTSSRTREQVAQAALAQGIQTDRASLREMAVLERRLSVFQIHIRHADPQTAASLANLWGQLGIAELQRAHDYALQARSWSEIMDTLTGCAPYPEPPTAEFESCRIPLGHTIDGELAEARQQRQQALWEARGISPALIFALTEEAELPVRPVQFGRNTVVFWGAAIGFMAGVGLVGLRQK